MSDKDLMALPFPCGVMVSEFELALLDRRRELELRLFRVEVVEATGRMFDQWMNAIRDDIRENRHHLRDLCATAGFLEFIDGLDKSSTTEPEPEKLSTIGGVQPPLDLTIEGPTTKDGHTHRWRYVGTFFPTKPPIWHMTCPDCRWWALLGNVMDEDWKWLNYASEVHEIRDERGMPVPPGIHL